MLYGFVRTPTSLRCITTFDLRHKHCRLAADGLVRGAIERIVRLRADGVAD